MMSVVQTMTARLMSNLRDANAAVMKRSNFRMDGQPLRMNEDLLSEFYACYERVGNKIIYFEVTCPDGVVKYYTVRHFEIQ